MRCAIYFQRRAGTLTLVAHNDKVKGFNAFVILVGALRSLDILQSWQEGSREALGDIRPKHQSYRGPQK